MSQDLAEPAKAIYQQAFALHQQGRLVEAQLAYQQALHLQRHSGTLTMLGVLALQLGNFNEAIALLDEAIASDPSNVMGHTYQGMSYSQLGRHDAAVACYDRAIAIDPEGNALPHYNRANALLQLKQYEAAVEGYERTISIESDLDAEAYFERGIALRLLKQEEAAIKSFDQAIALDSPRKSTAYFNRGVSFQELGQHENAVNSFDHALALSSDYADAHRSRGVSLHRLGLCEAALASLESFVALKPSDAEAHYNCGVVQADLGRAEAAIESFSRALSLRPDYVQALNGRGVVLGKQQAHVAALSDYETAISVDPSCAITHINRGNALLALGKPEAARASFELATQLNPEDPIALNCLGIAQKELGNLAAALTAHEAAIRVKRDFADAYANAGVVLQNLRRIEEAERMMRLGIELNPSVAYMHSNLGHVLKDGGDIESAVECYRKALDLDPLSMAAHSNLAFSLMFTSARAEPILAECRRFNARFTAAVTSGDGRRRNGALHGPRLRVGYVSPDFKDHCQSFFTLPLLENHDHSAFEIFCYSSVKRPDHVTRLISGHADVFRDVSSLNDDQLATLVSNDGIDILVDLTMHMDGGRPLLFAKRPAPVQVAWLAYPGTTGIDAIDYRFSDPRLDPPGFEAHYSERTVRLPDAFWCYDPKVPRPDVSPLPASSRGYLTLGCLNNPCKLTDLTLRLWAPLLRQLPTARLLLMVPDGKYRSQLLARARAAGIDESNVHFVDRRPRDEYLNSYHDIDLCLDTLPYNGHTTNLDALWMGVPTVTRVGMTSPGRAGLSVLYQIGLTELAADTDEAFVSVAATLAKDLPRLAALRHGLRSRLESSPLMNGKRFAAHIEAAYRTIHSTPEP